MSRNLIGRKVKVISECGVWGEVGDILTIVDNDTLDSNCTVDLVDSLVELYAIEQYPQDFEILPPVAIARVTSAEGTITSQGQSITQLQPKPIKSDGGSSGYYDIPIPDSFVETLMERYDAGNAHIRTEELIRYVFGNDFDFGTAFKSMVRAYGITQGGGKEGNDIRYECNKVKYYAEKIATIHA